MNLYLPAALLGPPVLAALAGSFAGCAALPRDAAPPEHKKITTEVLKPYECGTIAHLHPFGGSFLASQPRRDDLEHAQKSGVKTVVNLRHASKITDVLKAEEYIERQRSRGR